MIQDNDAQKRDWHTKSFLSSSSSSDPSSPFHMDEIFVHGFILPRIEYLSQLDTNKKSNFGNFFARTDRTNAEKF